MKKLSAIAAFLLLFSISLFAQNETLRGDEAIKQLQKTGQYDSLMDAVKDARKENGQTDEPQTEDAIGQTTKLTATGGAANDFFGWSVAISGDTAIIGAYSDDVGANADQGSAYVFVRSGTVWIQQAQLNGSGGAANDQFGLSVAISGNTAIVGAYQDNVGANTDQGSAYVFVRSGIVWTQQQQLTASDGAVNDQFGYNVAINGDTTIVGAPFDDVGATGNQGSAYVFVRSGIVWTQQAQLNASDGGANDFFGRSVAISGDTTIVGAYGDNVGATGNQGSAYVFRVLGTNWTQEAQNVASDGAANDNFGFSVAINGDTAIVGAYIDDVGANNEQGSAYIFVRSGTAWTQQQQIFATGGAAGDQFGYAVAIYGDTAIVGANFDTVSANADQGSAYVFVRSGTVWTQEAQITATGGTANDQFGNSVAISGNTVIVGANTDDVGINANQGSAYIFTRSGIVWTQQAQLNATGGAIGDNFGWSVALNDDTAIIGAYADDLGVNVNQGSAYVFVRSGTVWTQQAQLTTTGGAASDRFGNSVAISGDKIIVGAPNSDVSVNVPLVPQAADQGAVFMFVNNFAPTAAGVSVGGRILNADGNGVRNAIVSLTLANGEVLTTRSSAFGYYNFDDLEAGQTIVVSVISKRFQFVPQVVTLNESVAELNFWAQ